MNQLRVFNNPEFGQVRSITIDNEAWFVGKDVAEILGYQNVSDALATHIDEEDKKQIAFRDLQEFGLVGFGTKGAQAINESGLYSLVFSSKLPTAKQFKRWVTNEVLPSIRKTGSYSTNNAQGDNFNQIYKIIRALSSAPKTNLPYVVRAVELQYPGIFDGIEWPTSNNNQKPKVCHNDNSSILKFLDENDVLGEPTNQVYANYLDFCKSEQLNPTNNINFSRQVVKILDIKIAVKKICGRNYRMFISK
jgi:prophage antirepressor-like protein